MLGRKEREGGRGQDGVGWDGMGQEREGRLLE